MLTTHAVGIDLGTTYSCIAYLNEHGEPVTLPNQEGEQATPSVVLFDGDELVVGTEALRNAIVRPHRVVQNSKRVIGDPSQFWKMDGKRYTPVDIAACILKKLLSAAQAQIGPIEEAVITVPAQFSDAQRHATTEAGHRAGLERVDIINEPIAAALCYVLGTEGLWFSELADEQRIMVYDLGGGTFDLSLVRYHKEEVAVIASGGDLELGGMDWTNALRDSIGDRFHGEFNAHPREDAESLQFLTLEAEQTKRSLSVRPRAAIICQHAGGRKSYQIAQDQFERLAKPLVERTARITKQLLKDNKMSWAHVDVVLATGGASRMPMIRDRLKKLSGTTLNTTLSPDQSIAHGATYYAGMLLTNKKFAKSILNERATSILSRVRQRSVNARALGILVRAPGTKTRVPYYLIPANTTLPAEITEKFGTVVANQKRVHLQIIESGTSADRPLVKLGDCVIEGLPPHLPQGSGIAVTISYDSEARVHVAARDVTSGREASSEILRQENLVPQLEQREDADVVLLDVESPPKVAKAAEGKPAGKPGAAKASTAGNELESADQPIPLCNACGEVLDVRGACRNCGSRSEQSGGKRRRATSGRSGADARATTRRTRSQSGSDGASVKNQKTARTAAARNASVSGAPRRSKKKKSAPAKSKRPDEVGEDDFWDLVQDDS